jgi:hypothetical protein
MDSDSMITVANLTQAIKNSIDRDKGMEEDQAYALAQHVLNFFGYSDRIIDNILEPEDRDAFYMLEDAGILTTEREETTLYDGREWRIHYWLFRRDKIADLMLSGHKSAPAAVEADSFYSDLPDDVWDSRKDDTSGKPLPH